MHMPVSKCRMTRFIALLLVCMLCITSAVLCQGNAHKMGPMLKLANVPSGNNMVITSYNPVLSDPTIVCTEPGWKVITFTLSFQPVGKDYYGPFITKGPKLTEKETDLLKYFRDQGIQKVKVFIEDIKAQGPDGVVRSFGSILFTIQQLS